MSDARGHRRALQLRSSFPSSARFCSPRFLGTRHPPTWAFDSLRAIRSTVTTPPHQTPKLVSAGLAMGPYRTGERYASTGERPRLLYLEFDGPPGDPRDQYFARVLAYRPDP